MKTYLKLFAIVLICALGVFLINKVFKLPDDNRFEQLVEEVVKEETGISVDFTPKK